MRFEIDDIAFRWEARVDSEWVFVPLSAEASADIAEVPRPRRGFGGVRVRVEIGGSSWSTSIFPDATRGRYVVPLKRAVREAEGIEVGEPVRGAVEILG